MQAVAPAFDLILTSDGSGNSLQSGGCACIVEAPGQGAPGEGAPGTGASGTGRRYKLAAVLGPCTGNEAEILGGVLGLLAITELRKMSAAITAPRIRWQTDSKYLIRTVEQLSGQCAMPARLSNQGLWTAFQAFRSDFAISTMHVRARSGNRRNEACDHAARWIKRSGITLLSRFGEGRVGRMKETNPEESWVIFDLRDDLLAYRMLQPGEEIRNPHHFGTVFDNAFRQ